MPSRLADLEFSDDFNVPSIIAVGGTIDASTLDNKSIIVKFNAIDGTISGQKIYDLPGREFLEVILKHKTPLDPSFPFYILGRKNPVSLAPSTFDVEFLINLNSSLNSPSNVNWFTDYDYGTLELEAFYGLVGLNSGNVLILGNGLTGVNGVIIEVDGATGSSVQTSYYPDLILYDGVELGNGDIAISATQYSTLQGVLFTTNNSINQFSFKSGLLFPNVSSFREIGIDHDENLYTVAPEKTGGFNHIIHKSIYDNTNLSQIFTRYVYDNEVDFESRHLEVTPTYDAIFYADGRSDNPSGFGDYDILVGSFDLNLDNACRVDLPNSAIPFSTSHQQIFLNDTNYIEPAFVSLLDTVSIDYNCNNFCTPIDTCDFTWVSNCLAVNFTETITNVASPYIVVWDFDGDLVDDFTGSNPSFNYPNNGTWNVRMRVFNSAGTVVCSVTKLVNIFDNIPPVPGCPSDITLSTGAGSCTAQYAFSLMAIDNCDPNPIVNCSSTGATTISSISTQPNNYFIGVTTVDCIVTDDMGNSSSCSFNITVIDNEPPAVSCPIDIITNATVCAGGTYVNLTLPTVTDNCLNSTITSSHQSGDFFPCGNTIVTITATDANGNISTCNYTVTVNCECTEIISSDLECTNTDNEYLFTISFNDLTGSNNSTCVVNMLSTQSGVVILTQNFTPGIPMTVTGTLQFATTPIPTTVGLDLVLNCICPNGDPYTCSTPITMTVPCCKEIMVDESTVCKTIAMVSIPLVGCSNLIDVQQVRWYVSDAPCPSQGNFGAPFQVTNSCSPLILDPRYHNGNICIYAEVSMGSMAGPCTLLTSNTATITLCEPISCSVDNQEFCYFGSPITPNLLTASLSPGASNCSFTAKWFDENNVLVGTGLTYQAPALSMSIGSQACAEYFTYRCEVTNNCGISIGTSTIKLNNDDAPIGNLYLSPSEILPLCPGEDAVLQYDKACAGSPAEWEWFKSSDNFVLDITPLPNNGTMNDTYMTNRLYQDTWIRVKKQNGNCPVDSIDFFIDVTDSLKVANFNAGYSPLCNPTEVNMNFDILQPNYAAPSTCNFTIDWYRNGTVLTSVIQNTPTASYTYSGGLLSGNYYAIVTDNCCPSQRVKTPVITIDPPMEVVIAGPCFHCNCDIVELEAIIINEYAGCTYQWYENGVIMPGETNNIIQVSPELTHGSVNIYTFEVICPNGCIDTQVFNLAHCGILCTVGVEDIAQVVANLYPNPANDQITIDFEKETGKNTYFEMSDLMGRRIALEMIEVGSKQFIKSISSLPAGIYYVGVIENGIPIFIEEVVIE